LLFYHTLPTKANESHWQAQSLSTSFPLQGLQACSVGPWALPTICTERRVSVQPSKTTIQPGHKEIWDEETSHFAKDFVRHSCFSAKGEKQKQQTLHLVHV